jgi:hypothetical protein
MLIAVMMLAAALAQQPAATPELEIPVLDASLGGDCSADFTVKDAEGESIYAAAIHVRVRYGFLGIKRADLEVGTNSDGKARIEGLSTKSKPMVYRIEKAERETTEEQDVKQTCNATFEVTLK